MTEMNEIIIDDEVLNGLVSSVPATAEGLDSIMEDIVYKRGGNRTNPYIVAKRTECPEFQFLPYAKEIVKRFDTENTVYWNLILNRNEKSDELYEQMRAYISTHDIDDTKTQGILYLLLSPYISKCLFDEGADLIAIAEKPEKKTSKILSSLIEYYCKTADFEKASAYAAEYKEQFKSNTVLYANSTDRFYGESNYKSCMDNFERWTGNKPFWPRGENLINYLSYLDRHGLKHAGYVRNEVTQKDFDAPEFSYDDLPDSFCTIECSNVYTSKQGKHTYEIAMVKVIDGKQTDACRTLVRPRCGQSELEKIVKKTGISEEQFTSLPYTDQAVDELLKYIGDLPLVSIEWTAKDHNTFEYFCRLIRKGGIKKLNNTVFELLEAAADQDIDADTRKELLDHFKLTETDDIMSRALADAECAKLLKE